MTQKRGLEIHSLEQQAQEATAQLWQALTADRRLWLDATQTKLVEDGDPAAAFQLAAPGHRITASEAKRLGLYMHDGRIEQDVKPDAPVTEKSPADDKKEKKGSAPGEDKQRKPAESK